QATHGDVVLVGAHLGKRLRVTGWHEYAVPLEVLRASSYARNGAFDGAFEQVHLVAIAVAQHRLGSNLVVAQRGHEVCEALGFQPVPEDLGQARGKVVQSPEVETRVLDEQRATDLMKRLDQ